MLHKRYNLRELRDRAIQIWEGGSKENIMEKAQVELGIEEWLLMGRHGCGGDTGRSIPGRDTSVSKDLEEGNFIQSR